MTWITNCPESAAKLTAADAAYERARNAAKALNLADKIEALRKAKAERVAAYAKAVLS